MDAANLGRGARRMRLFVVLPIAFICLSISHLPAAADQRSYYVTVACDPQHRSATIALEETWDSPPNPEPPEDRQAISDTAVPQSFELQSRSGPGECHLTPDILLRAKVGEGLAMPYGQCGADPDVFLSLWVDKRRWLSRLGIGGRCADTILKTIEITPEAVKICWKPDPDLNEANPAPETCAVQKASEFPQSIDTVEYAANPQERVAGTITIEHAEDPALCHAMVKPVRNAFGQPDWSVDVPSADHPFQRFPERGARLTRDMFDIDNDGTEEVVYGSHTESHAYDADVYFASPGPSVDSAWPNVAATAVSVSPYVFPSRFARCGDRACGAIGEYAPRDAAISFRNERLDGVPAALHLYAFHEYPFLWNGATYFLVWPTGDEQFRAVLKPHPDGFDETCIFNKIPENF